MWVVWGCYFFSQICGLVCLDVLLTRVVALTPGSNVIPVCNSYLLVAHVAVVQVFFVSE